MPLLVKYEQTDSYFSWLSKQIKTHFSQSLYDHYISPTATLSETAAPITYLEPEPSLFTHGFQQKIQPEFRHVCFWRGLGASGPTKFCSLWRVSGLRPRTSRYSRTGFETLPPRSIVYKPFQFLKSICLKSVGLGFDYVPFHAG